MKVGLSFSRCIRDLVEGRVDFEDILVIITRTDFNPHNDEHWNQIWEGYRYGTFSEAEWMTAEPGKDEDTVNDMYRHVAKQLYDNGLIHQPRQFGSYRASPSYYWLDCIVSKDEMNPAVKDAWDQYQMLAGLSNR